MNVNAKRLVILGAGESGVGTAILGKRQGFDVFVSDKGIIKENYKNTLIKIGIDWEEGTHTEDKICNADLVMKSPGIPDTAPLVQLLRDKNIPVISEIEFAAAYTQGTLIGITGSNGKTTTTLLTYHLLKQAGLNVGVAGNVGKSFAQMVAEEDKEMYVLEISSFQLDGIKTFAPHIAVITNITPDHLDRYGGRFEDYIASKFRITMNQRENDYFIYDADDPVIEEHLRKQPVKSKRLSFSVEKKLEKGAYKETDTLVLTTDTHSMKIPTNTIPIEGKHNLKNALAASMVAMLLKVRKTVIRESMQHFQNVEHRLEKVLKIKNTWYINDSKATNVNAAYYALESVKTPIVWIVGGQDKGNDYSSLMPLVREKVKAIICLGIDNSKIIDAFGRVVDMMIETASMENAVTIAYKIAKRGDTVLLAPACASFDLFQNYEDRGRQFKEAVRKL